MSPIFNEQANALRNIAYLLANRQDLDTVQSATLFRTLEECATRLEAADIDAVGRAEHADSIEWARDQYVTDDIEIDDSPNVSPADTGCWVAAWVWVPASEVQS